jgi:hypothetical protein
MGKGTNPNVTPLEEAVYRYAESALISAVRLRRYWMSQGLSEDKAIERALKQAIGMLASSGLGPEKLLELFHELRGACEAFIKVLEDYVEATKKGTSN